MVRCPKCNKENPDWAAYCTGCLSELFDEVPRKGGKGPEAPAPKGPKQTPSAERAEIREAEEPTSSTEEKPSIEFVPEFMKERGLPWGKIVAVVVVVAIVGLAVYIVTRGVDQNITTSTLEVTPSWIQENYCLKISLKGGQEFDFLSIDVINPSGERYQGSAGTWGGISGTNSYYFLPPNYSGYHILPVLVPGTHTIVITDRNGNEIYRGEIVLQ